jgi:hypothetical protein
MMPSGSGFACSPAIHTLTAVDKHVTGNNELLLSSLREPAGKRTGGVFYFYDPAGNENYIASLVGSGRSEVYEVKTLSAFIIFLAIAAISIQFTTFAAANDSADANSPDTNSQIAPEGSADCSKEVWPHFSPACLRDANHVTAARLIKANRH